MRRVLTNATLIDCVNPRPVPGASVTIERGRIVEVLDGSRSPDTPGGGGGRAPGGRGCRVGALAGSRSPDTRGADVIDLAGGYLLPGLWDVHIHPDYLASTGASVAEPTAVFGYRLGGGPGERGGGGAGGGGRAVRRRRACHGRGVEARVRRRPARRPARLRGRLLPHHHR